MNPGWQLTGFVHSHDADNALVTVSKPSGSRSGTTKSDGSASAYISVIQPIRVHFPRADILFLP